MSPKFSLRWPAFSFAFIFLSVVLLAREQAPAQNSGQTSQRASLSMEQEHHHHLEFENSYVRVFFVEIPAHESTLFHRHDFPYLSVPPTGAGGCNAATTWTRRARDWPADDRLFARQLLPRCQQLPGFRASQCRHRVAAPAGKCSQWLRASDSRSAPRECNVPNFERRRRLPARVPLFETDEISVDGLVLSAEVAAYRLGMLAAICF